MTLQIGERAPNFTARTTKGRFDFQQWRNRAAWLVRLGRCRRTPGLAARVMALCLILSAALPAGAQVLEFQGALFDGAGLDGAMAAAVSPDGAHVYVAGEVDFALGVFGRDPATGELHLIEVERRDVDGVGFRFNPIHVTVSPDGRHVYVVSYDRFIRRIDGLVVFSRDASTGELSFVETLFDLGTDSAGNTINGIGDPQRIAISPDGAHAYVTSDQSLALTLLNRNPTTGQLTFVEALVDPGNTATSFRPIGVAVSPDGAHVYVTDANGIAPSIAVFRRNPADGTLTFVEELVNGSSDGSGNTIQGLRYPVSVAVSPDGGHVYVTGRLSNALVVFSRDATSGELAFVEALLDGGDDAAGNAIDGLDGAFGVRVSPDGAQVYATGMEDNAVAVFSRDSTTGALTFIEQRRNSQADVDGLREPALLAISPNGGHLYVPSQMSDAVVVFSRDADPGSMDFGRLSFVESQMDDDDAVSGLDGAFSLRLAPDGRNAYVAGVNDKALAAFSRDLATGELEFVQVLRDGSTDAVGNTVEGMDSAGAVAPSPDGAHVYLQDSNGVVAFRREPASGVLSFIEALEDGGTDAAGNAITGLEMATALAVSPDGGHLYVIGIVDSSVVLFERNPTTGRLSFVEALLNGGADSAGNTIDGMERPSQVSVSPDGTQVLVASGDGALAVFNRDADSGRLTFEYALFDGSTDSAGNTIDGLVGPQEITFSPDGAHVLIANLGFTSSGSVKTVVVFSRDPGGGALIFLEVLRDGATDAAGNPINSLGLIRSVAISPDGARVVSAGFGGTGFGGGSLGDNDALTVFSRNTDASSPDFGRLTLVEALRHRGVDGFGNDLWGLAGAASVVFSPNGKNVYTATASSDTVVVFDNHQGDPVDYGDAPDPTYPTLQASNGARHGLSSNLRLGTAADTDRDGQPNAGASGDDSDGIDDEDGVRFLSDMLPGQMTGIEVVATDVGLLDAFVDFNGDGDWDEANEKIFDSEPLSAGGNTLNFAVPTDALPGDTFSRFRLSNAGGLSFDGPAPDGEVEDYPVEILPVIPVTIGDFSMTEGDSGTTIFSFAASLASAAGETITVSFDTADGTATAAENDFEAITGGSVAIAAGDITGTAEVTVNGDAVFEGDETFTITLTGVTSGPGVIDSANATGTGTIQDDDPVSIMFNPSALDAIATVPEDAGVQTVPMAVILSNPTGNQAITVDVTIDSASTATNGADFNFIDPTTVSFAAGETEAELSLEVLDDADAEGPETVIFNLTNVTGPASTGSPASFTATIQETDATQVVGLSLSVTDVTEAGVANGSPASSSTITATLNAPASVDVVIALAFGGQAQAGTDFQVTDDPIVIAAGDTQGTAQLSALDDSLAEGDEFFTVSIASVTGAALANPPPQAQGNVVDDDRRQVTAIPIPTLGPLGWVLLPFLILIAAWRYSRRAEREMTSFRRP